MKRRELVRRLLELGAILAREGGEHTVYTNPRTGENLSVPRHAEISEHLARRLIRDARRLIEDE